MTIDEIRFGEDLLGQMSLVPVYATVLDPSLRLANAGIDPNAVVAWALVNQSSALVEHEAATPASEIRESLFLRADFHSPQFDHSDA